MISLPYLRIRVAQRAPYKPNQVAAPNYGEWLDVYLTVLKPLPLPTGGLLGERPRCSLPSPHACRAPKTGACPSVLAVQRVPPCNPRCSSRLIA
jgi:hypothetical protein